MPLAVQMHALVVTALTGVAVGLLFDVQRLLRRFLKPKGRAADAFDGAVAAVASVVVALGLFFAGWGELRHYALVGGGLGLALYLWLGSATVTWAGERVLHRAAIASSRLQNGAARAGRAIRGAAAALRGRLARILRIPLAPSADRREN